MSRYILRRLLLFIPTLLVISFMAFVISVKSPGDPVEIFYQAGNPQGGSIATAVSAAKKDSIRRELGLDKPLFYFSLRTAADSDTLYRVSSRRQRLSLDRLTAHYGNWQAVSSYYHALQHALVTQQAFNPDSVHTYLQSIGDSSQPASQLYEHHAQALNLWVILLETPRQTLIRARLDSLQRIYEFPVFEQQREAFTRVNSAFEKLQTEAQTWKRYIPAVSWYGTDNQYHRWLVNLIKGDFGYSYTDQKPVVEKIWPKFLLSIRLIFISVLLAYLVSIPLGVYSAYRKNSLFDRSASLMLFMLYSLPSFFVGMMLLFFFANPDYLVWFPEAGYMNPAKYDPNWPFYKRWWHEWPYMVLPLVTYTYSMFAFISRIMRTSMLESLSQDYIRTARAKGLSERVVVWRHAFRNSLLPVITVFVNIFPMAVGGSVIVETIFTYPGMGLASYEAIHTYDYPSIVAIFTLAGLLTMVGYLVADILYAWVDPRISYTKK